MTPERDLPSSTDQQANQTGKTGQDAHDAAADSGEHNDVVQMFIGKVRKGPKAAKQFNELVAKTLNITP